MIRSRSTPATRLDDRSDTGECEQEPGEAAPSDALAQHRPCDQHREDRSEPGDDDRPVRGGRKLQAVQEERVVAGDRGRSESEHERNVPPARSHHATPASRPDCEQQRREGEPRRGHREGRHVLDGELSRRPRPAEADRHREEEQVRRASLAHVTVNVSTRRPMPVVRVGALSAQGRRTNRATLGSTKKRPRSSSTGRASGRQPEGCRFEPGLRGASSWHTQSG